MFLCTKEFNGPPAFTDCGVCLAYKISIIRYNVERDEYLLSADMLFLFLGLLYCNAGVLDL